MNTVQLGYPERRGRQQGADGMREVQLGAGEDHHADSNETGLGWLSEPLGRIFRNSPEPEYVPPAAGLQVYLDYRAYMPDPVMLRETPAAKLLLDLWRTTGLQRR